MFVFLSKLLPLLIYPLGLACLALIAALFLRRRPRLRTGLMVFALLLLWLGGNRWISYTLARSLEWQYLPLADPPHVDAIVLLGGATEPALYPRLSPEVNSAGDRVLYAARLYQGGKASHILLSGGTITFLTNSQTTPADDMAGLLEQIGVPREALWLQNRSQNTYEDALYSKQLLEEHGAKRVLLVTSAMHMPRAMAIFRKAGLEVIPAPTDYTVTQDGWDHLFSGDPAGQVINLLPNTSSLGLTTNVLKEYIGLVVYRLQGWL